MRAGFVAVNIFGKWMKSFNPLMIMFAKNVFFTQKEYLCKKKVWKCILRQKSELETDCRLELDNKKGNFE